MDDDDDDLLCRENLDDVDDYDDQDTPESNGRPDDYEDLLRHEILNYEEFLWRRTFFVEEEEEEQEDTSDPLMNEIVTFARTRNTCAFCDPIRQGEYLRLMLQREIALGFGSSIVDQYLVNPYRSEAISWILKAREAFGFLFQTAYMSVSCFDRFLSSRTMIIPDDDNFRTITMACVSLTVNTEEGNSRIIRDYRWEGYHINPEDIKKMEFEIFKELDIFLYSVSPFVFLHYWIAKLFENPPPDAFLLRIYGFIFSLMREVDLMAHRPSAIAAAAAMVASNQRLSRHALASRMNLIVCPDFPDIEHVFQCYKLMRRLGAEDLRQANGQNTPQVSPNGVTPTSTPHNFSRTSSSDIIRRRLDFDGPYLLELILVNYGLNII